MPLIKSSVSANDDCLYRSRPTTPTQSVDPKNIGRPFSKGSDGEEPETEAGEVADEEQEQEENEETGEVADAESEDIENQIDDIDHQDKEVDEEMGTQVKTFPRLKTTSTSTSYSHEDLNLTKRQNLSKDLQESLKIKRVKVYKGGNGDAREGHFDDDAIGGPALIEHQQEMSLLSSTSKKKPVLKINNPGKSVDGVPSSLITSTMNQIPAMSSHSTYNPSHMRVTNKMKALRYFSTSKYDFVKVKVYLKATDSEGNTKTHHSILSRYIIRRMLTSVNVKSIYIFRFFLNLELGMYRKASRTIITAVR